MANIRSLFDFHGAPILFPSPEKLSLPPLREISTPKMIPETVTPDGNSLSSHGVAVIIPAEFDQIDGRNFSFCLYPPLLPR